MSDWGVFLDELEHQLDAVEAAIAGGAAYEPGAPFTPPPVPGPVPPDLAGRALAAQQRLLAAQQLVGGELERTRKELAMTGDVPEAPRFLDTTF